MQLSNSKNQPSVKISVDASFSSSLGNDYQVLRDYSAMMNQTDILSNTNKFYLIQLLHSTKEKTWVLGRRWGRVGEKGNITFQNFPNEYAGISAFKKMFSSKTSNTWGNTFVPKMKKYTLITTLQEEDIEEKSTSPVVETETETTSVPLHPALQSFIRRISNRDMMNAHLSSMNLDPKRLPLGKITKRQLEVANRILEELSEYMRRDVVDNVKEAGIDDPITYINANIAELSSKYWTVIPYASKRNTPPPVIRSLQDVQSQAANLDTLYNMGILGRMKMSTDLSTQLNDVYKGMDIELASLDKRDVTYQLLQTYIQNTHGSSHGYGVEIIAAHTVKKQRSAAEDKVFKKTPNHVLLFHGSRLPNFVGILTEGLRIPSSNNVVNGSVLGMGIYFANCITKSFNYCGVSSNGEVGVVLVCEVALGESDIVVGPTFDTHPVAPYTSRTACGRNTPAINGYRSVQIDDVQVTIPCGGITVSPYYHSSFVYDEFVVYNVAHYRIRYVLELAITR